MFALTDIGQIREINEDYCETRINAFGEVLLMVADGMGGRNHGDYASKYLCDYLAKEFLSTTKRFRSPRRIKHWIYKNVNLANRHLYLKRKSVESKKIIGTTLSLVILSGNYMVIAQAGDSRVYIINRDNNLQQLSVDQSYVQYLEHSHLITSEEKATHPERHKITNAVGIRYRVNLDIKSFDYSNQKILICSDGLYNNVPESNIASILRGNETPERKCKQLVSFANSNGGSDNLSVVIWETNN